MQPTKKGLAILECYQEIPCNPCVTACKTGAISKTSLNSCPTIDESKCTGCRSCVSACPGQAIFFQVADYDENYSTISFPYEFLPYPEVGQIVTASDRNGNVVCETEVLSVDINKVMNKTAVVTLKIPKEYKDTIRFMKRIKTPWNPDDNVIVCRCEEVSKQEILTAIEEGAFSVTSIKKATRAGMGACQGRTCCRLVQQMLVSSGVKTANSFAADKPRFPIVPCTIEALEGDD